jgi:hypothetical protein
MFKLRYVRFTAPTRGVDPRMSFHDYLRFFVGACGVVGLVFVVRGIVTGRWQHAGAFIVRIEEAKTYWLVLARYAVAMAGMVLVATIVPERLFTPVLMLFLFVPALALALLTGRFEWEADDKRIDSPRRFWGWVTFYAVLIALFVFIFFAEAFTAS